MKRFAAVVTGLFNVLNVFTPPLIAAVNTASTYVFDSQMPFAAWAGVVILQSLIFSLLAADKGAKDWLPLCKVGVHDW